MSARRTRLSRPFPALLLSGLLLLLSPGIHLAEEAEKAVGEESGPGENARFRVRGYGFWNNLQLTRTLRLLEGEEARETFDRNFVEDAVLLLLNQMQQDGYLRPTVEVRVRSSGGTEETFSFDHTFDTLLPSDLAAARVHFQLRPGVLFYFQELTFSGLTDNLGREMIPESDARGYFLVEGFLLDRRTGRVYTPSSFNRSANNLREMLQRAGYRDARVTSEITAIDETSGQVKAQVNIVSGPRFIVRKLREKVFIDNVEERASLEIEEPLVPYSRLWAQDVQIRLRNMFFRQGYPRARTRLTIDREEMIDGEMMVDVTAIVETGTRVTVGDILFAGNERTRDSIMRRRVPLESGEPLDRMAAERGRQRLGAMGSFERVGFSFIDTDDDVWDILYTVEEGRRLDINVLLGYGSYEYLRGGLEVEQFNLFGRGHRSRFLVTQSFKSSGADYTYSIPELFGERVSGFARAEALRREELDFTRQEIGLSTGVQRSFTDLGLDMGLRYSFSYLESRALEEEQQVARPTSRVGAITWDVRRDRRNNPIYPRRGYHLSSGLEVAATMLGGQAEYLRWEMGGSTHFSAGPGRVIHLGATHGILQSFGEDVRKLPFNKRFFPGGDNSQRGYRFGQAASRGSGGAIIGSESYLLAQVELEQALTDRVFALIFLDQIWLSEDLSDYLGDDVLRTIGLGLRYETIVGPIRLEYGYNFDRRPEDPSGTVHLTIGFPF